MKERTESEITRNGESLISVIIPVYNGDAYLAECLDSVVSQSMEQLDIIVVDDGSTDASPGICDSYAERDPRVRVIHQSNGGVSAARNAALDIAKGRYIGFVDADDKVRPQFFETLYGLLCDAPPNSILACGCEILTAEGVQAQALPEDWQKQFTLPAAQAYPYLLYPGGYECYIGSKLIDRAFFVGKDGLRFHEDLALCEDRLLIMELLLRASTVLFTSEGGYLYRFREGSTGGNNKRSGSPLRALEARKRVLAILPPAYTDYDGAAYTRLLAHAVCEADRNENPAAFAALRKEYLEARKKYAQALRHWRQHTSLGALLTEVAAQANIAPGYALVRKLRKMRG